MPDWGSVAGGGLSGAAAGAGIGSVVPVIGTGIGAAIGGGIGALAGWLGGGDEDQAKAIAQQRADFYRQLFNQYMGPDSASQQALAQLEQLSKTGLSDTDRAAAYKLLGQADEFARGQEGALQLQDQASGKGLSSSAQTSALQAQSAQAAAGRLSAGETAIAGEAASRKQQALMAFLDQKARNDQMLMQWKLSVAGGQDRADANLQDLLERNNYASTQNLYHGLDSAATAGMTLAKLGQQKQPVTQPVPNSQAAPPRSSADAAPAAASPYQATQPAPQTMQPMGQPQQQQGSLYPVPQKRDPYGIYDLSPLLDQPEPTQSYSGMGVH